VAPLPFHFPIGRGPTVWTRLVGVRSRVVALLSSARRGSECEIWHRTRHGGNHPRLDICHKERRWTTWSSPAFTTPAGAGWHRPWFNRVTKPGKARLGQPPPSPPRASMAACWKRYEKSASTSRATPQVRTDELVRAGGPGRITVPSGAVSGARAVGSKNGKPPEALGRTRDGESCASSQSAPGHEADMAPGPVLRGGVRRLLARFNAIVRSSTCSRVTNLVARDGAHGRQGSGIPSLSFRGRVNAHRGSRCVSRSGRVTRPCSSSARPSRATLRCTLAGCSKRRSAPRGCPHEARCSSCSMLEELRGLLLRTWPPPAHLVAWACPRACHYQAHGRANRGHEVIPTSPSPSCQLPVFEYAFDRSHSVRSAWSRWAGTGHLLSRATRGLRTSWTIVASARMRSRRRDPQRRPGRRGSGPPCHLSPSAHRWQRHHGTCRERSLWWGGARVTMGFPTDPETGARSAAVRASSVPRTKLAARLEGRWKRCSASSSGRVCCPPDLVAWARPRACHDQVHGRANHGHEINPTSGSLSGQLPGYELAFHRSHIVRSACARRCGCSSQSASCHARTTDQLNDRGEHRDAEQRKRPAGGRAWSGYTQDKALP